MKRITLCFAALAFFFSAPLFAQNGSPKLVDRANLLNDGTAAEIESQLKLAAEVYNFDVVILTEKTIGGALPMNYADDFFDNNGYGLGNNYDGCILLIVEDSRDYWISTTGRGIKLLDENAAAFGKLERDLLKYLSVDDYTSAFQSFAADMENFLFLEAKGRRYNFFHEYNAVLTAAAWVLALIISFIVVQVWKSQMNTALPRTQANAYMLRESLAFTVKNDRFLYSTVTKTRRQTESSSSGGGIHTGSSGRSHGGGGGKF